MILYLDHFKPTPDQIKHYLLWYFGEAYGRSIASILQ